MSRLLSGDLILSCVPEAEQRCRRTLTRTKYQLTRDKVRLQSQLESLLEECQIKLSRSRPQPNWLLGLGFAQDVRRVLASPAVIARPKATDPCVDCSINSRTLLSGRKIVSSKLFSDGRRLSPRLGYAKAVWAIAHHLCRLIWKILHEGVSYVESGPTPPPITLQRRRQRLVTQLKKLGYQVQLIPVSLEPSSV